MGTKILSIFLLLAVISTIMAKPISLEQQWDTFKATHGKSYNSEEEKIRLQIFKDNVKNIEEHNKKYDAGEVTYKMGINQFADLTPEEFKKHLGLRVPHQTKVDANKENS